VTELKTGILLWSQAATWPEMTDAAKRVDELGYDHLWTWDHLYAIFGDPYQPIFEGWMALAGWAMATERTRLGLLVGANTFRNPGLTAKLAETLDHISDGRAILGIGGAWMEPEHQAHGIDFGSGFGQRLDWMDEAVAAMRTVMDGGSATSSGDGRYAFDDLRHAPLPIQKKLPIMIGGSGEKKTLRTVAKYADMWNAMGPLDVMAHKVDVLKRHCDEVGGTSTRSSSRSGSSSRSATPRKRRTGSGRRRWNTTVRHCPRSRTTTPSGMAPPSRWPTSSARTWTSASGPSSRSSRHRTTWRPFERFIGEVKPLIEKG
jgi:alkanesulfonate monooxygenase SsuD/methylene tetrahydromethanopterin reductase-like flavin-dependent oxidoreductase (luciferase family)